jgi:Uma2 family endonuclease
MSTTALLPDDVALAEDEIEEHPERFPDHFEIINGKIVETPYMSNFAEGVASRLNRVVYRYLNLQDIGEANTERLFHIPQPDDEGRNRRPDWSFVSYQRWPKDRPYSYRGAAWEVVPDIAAEVISPWDLADDAVAKAREYLRGGVRLAWIVYPLAQEIHAYWPGTNQIRVYFAADELDAGDVLPGFRTSVADLFPPLESPPPAPGAP